MDALLPEEWNLARIRAVAQCPTAQFMPTSVPVSVETRSAKFAAAGRQRVLPEVIIRLDDYALVKPVGGPDWFVGEVRGGEVVCRTSAGSDLEGAASRAAATPEQPPYKDSVDGAARTGEICSWSAAVAAWTLLWALILRTEGPGADAVVSHLLAWLAGLIVLSVLAGARQWGRPWRLTLLYAALFAAAGGVVLILLIGPDSGTAGTCSPGEACDMEQGLGFFTAPLMLATPLLAVMTLSRLLMSAGRRLVRKAHGRRRSTQAAC